MPELTMLRCCLASSNEAAVSWALLCPLRCFSGMMTTEWPSISVFMVVLLDRRWGMCLEVELGGRRMGDEGESEGSSSEVGDILRFI